MTERKYDVIILGATGFTGQITSRYLASHVETEGIRWAIAGRNKEKLENVRHNCSGHFPDLCIADVMDMDSLKALTAQTHILMNAAGPFALYGEQVIQSCILTSTHYLDITGEPSFVAKVYNDYFYKAESQNTCIVNCCGFDSIPADYAAWLTARALPHDLPKKLYGFVRTNATFSGGTLSTAVHALHNESRKISYKTHLPKHPDAPRIPLKIHYNKDVNHWAIPMPVVDPHIVKRSIYRLSNEYGPASTYAQFWLRSSFLKVLKTVVPVTIGIVGIRFKFFRERLLKKFKPGTGPDESQRARTRFEVICIGKTADKTVKTVFSGADPGYDETAKMFSQAAFVLHHKRIHQSITPGVLTPVEALGEDLINRLRKENIRIETMMN